MKARHFTSIFFVLVLSIALPSCVLFSSPHTSSGWINWDTSGGWSRDASNPLALESTGASPLLEEADEAPSSSGEDALRSEDETTHQAPNLRAGSVDDNALWDDYLLYRQQFAQWGIHVHDLDVTERHVITIADQYGLPVLGASIRILSAQGERIADMQTTSEGRVLFFPRLHPFGEDETFQIEVNFQGERTTQQALRSEREHTMQIQRDELPDPVRLDVHFLIDATGSMADEIQQLKENMIAIAESVQLLDPEAEVRFGMTVYRDRGDLFVSRTLDFTPDVEHFVEELRAVVAEGGGDYAESLNEGLHDALHLPEWRSGSCIRLVFLIADAPPHLDYANDYDYATEAIHAASQGVKIYPLASSGLDDQGEFIFRQLAQISGGRFLFLTYGAGGAPGDDTTHHVDDYSVLSLDQLVLRMIEEELTNLSTATQSD